MLCENCEEQYFKQFYAMSYDLQSADTTAWKRNMEVTYYPMKGGTVLVPLSRAEDLRSEHIAKQIKEAQTKKKKKRIRISRNRLAKFIARHTHQPKRDDTPHPRKEIPRKKKKSNKIHVEFSAMSLQSGEATAMELSVQKGEEAETVEQPVVMFADANAGEETGYAAPIDSTSTLGDTTQVELAKFLERPALISNFVWYETDTKGPISVQFSPWYEFFNKASIKKKLDNYAFIRGNLHLKVVTNASPFLYGMLQFAYEPLPAYSYNPVVKDAFYGYFTNYSQRPSIWIEPQSQSGGEMILPFLWPKNYVNVTSATDLQELGSIEPIVYAVLQSANGVTTAGVSVQVYAWLTDLELAGPTAALAVQSGEWGVGPISKPASAVASVAKRLSDVPIIGPFAKATDIGASAISSIASIFGFTNVPNIEEHCPVHPSPFPKLAVTDAGYPTSQLTLDVKNELTIDPAVTGVESDDQLAITNLVTREAWLTDFTWAGTDTTQKNLFTCLVTPTLYNVATGTNETYMQMTPLAWVARMFEYWRGDIIFRIKLVCSPYHKGRLKISFDPLGSATNNILSSTDMSNIVYTRIVDIGKDTDIEFRVPYTQATAWLRVATGYSAGSVAYSTAASPSFANNAINYNGYFNVKVLNVLTGPAATASITGQVFVRAADNFEVAGPIGLPSWSLFAVQSGQIQIDMGDNTGVDQDKKYLVYMGESVGSLRKLLRRSTYANRYYLKSTTTSGQAVMKVDMTRFPVGYGFDPNGIHEAFGTVSTTTYYKFNWVDVTPLSWVIPAFKCVRGSMNWTFNVSSKNGIKSLRFSRLPTTAVTSAQSVSYSTTPSTNSVGAYNLWNTTTGLAPGAAIVDQRTNAGLSVVMPNYSNHKFQSTGRACWTAPPGTGSSVYDTSAFDGGRLEVLIDCDQGDQPNATTIHTFCGAGTDFALSYFINVPTFRIYGVPNPA